METILIASCRILLSLFVIFEHVNICRFIYSSVHFHFHSSLSTFLSSFSAGCSLGRRQTRFSIFFRHLRDFLFDFIFSLFCFALIQSMIQWRCVLHSFIVFGQCDAIRSLFLYSSGLRANDDHFERR